MMANFGEFLDFKSPQSAPTNSKTLETLSEFLSKQELLSVMAKYLQAKVFVVDRYVFHEMVTSNPFAMRDECLKMEVSVTTTSSGLKEDHRFFVKRLSLEPRNCYEKEVKARGFLKETELYSSLFGDFEKAEKDGINRWGPKYYLSKPGRLLVLDDLPSKGYYQIGRRDCLDREHIVAVIRTLAAFHAATIKLEKANGGRTVTAGDAFSNFEYGWDKAILQSGNLFLEAGIKSQVNLVDQLPGYSRDEIQEIQNRLPGLLRKLPELAKPSRKFKNVFIHGRLSPTNIFFRRRGGKLEAVLIDFQTVRYAPPAYDLIMLMHLNQRIVFRMKERQTLIQTYYNMFSEELAKNGICVQDVLPVKDYLESCEDCTEWVVLATVLYYQIHLLSDEVITKYLSEESLSNKVMIKDRTDMITECFCKDEVYRTRMTEAMNDLIKKCIELP